MGLPKRLHTRKYLIWKKEIVNMRSGIIISLFLGLAICLVEVKGQCECTKRTAKTNTGAVLGDCKTGDFNPGPNKGRKFCYVKGKYEVDDCCEADTSRFPRLCVNYSLCEEEEEEDEYDYEEEEEEEEEEDIEEDDKTEDITDPRTATGG